MRLRNKKTGEIVEAESCNSYSGTIGLFFEKGRETDRAYDSLAELNDEWEDYKPAEPLIKDEKIRKAVRAWAEACYIDTAQYDEYWRSFRCDDCVIGFKDEDTVLDLRDGEWYTITELCGSKEIDTVKFNELVERIHEGADGDDDRA